jgi:hypothetical protein
MACPPPPTVRALHRPLLCSFLVMSPVAFYSLFTFLRVSVDVFSVFLSLSAMHINSACSLSVCPSWCRHLSTAGSFEGPSLSRSRILLFGAGVSTTPQKCSTKPSGADYCWRLQGSCGSAPQRLTWQWHNPPPLITRPIPMLALAWRITTIPRRYRAQVQTFLAKGS